MNVETRENLAALVIVMVVGEMAKIAGATEAQVLQVIEADPEGETAQFLRRNAKEIMPMVEAKLAQQIGEQA